MSEPTSKDFEDNQLTSLEAHVLNVLVVGQLGQFEEDEELATNGNNYVNTLRKISAKLDWQAGNANRFEPIKTIGSREQHYKRKW